MILEEIKGWRDGTKVTCEIVKFVGHKYIYFERLKF